MALDTPQSNGSADALARTAQQLGLKVIRLTASSIQPAALAFVPESLARELRVLPVSYDEAGKRLTLALADPSLLSKPAPAFLRDLKAKGISLELVVVTGDDFTEAVASYATGAQATAPNTSVPATTTTAPLPVTSAPAQKPEVQPQAVTPPAVTPSAPKSPSANVAMTSTPTPPAPSEQIPASVHSAQVPKTALKGKTIPLDVLERFPQDVATKYQMVVFELSADGKTASVAAVNPDDRRVREILKFVEERNGLRINVFQTTKEDLDEALRGYGATAAPVAEVKETPSKPASPRPTETPKPLPTPGVDVKRASADQVKQAVKRDASATLPASAPSPSPASPLPNVGGASQPGVKVGGMTPTMTPAQYQQTITRNSRPDESTQPVAQIDARDIQTPGGEVGQMGLPQTALELTVEERNLDTIVGGTISDPSQLETIVKSGMVPKIVAAFISFAVTSAASDIHIEASREYVRVRYRVDGELREIIRLPIGLLPPLVSRLKILAKLKIDESRVPQDGRFDVQAAGHEIDLRVSTLPTVFGEKVVLRILDKSSSLRKLEELGLQGTNLERIRGVIDDPYGIILVTGPTGSGKTSTLYAMLNELNTAGVNIVTLEDPVEYQLEGVNQTQVRPAIGFGFADGLRSILRQDPNIIMVGEIRDKQTAALATQAALTGHLVLSTLHTNDAAGAIPRMLDMGVEPFLLASSLKAIIGQRLIRRLIPDAKAQVSVPAEALEAVKAELARGKAPEIVSAVAAQPVFYGPSSTGGFRGRLGIYEVLTMSDALSNLTLQKAAASKIAEVALAEGMVTMRQDGILKAMAGDTSLDEVLQATAEK